MDTDTMHEKNLVYTPSKPYYLYITIEGEKYKVESSQYEKAKKRAIKGKKHSISRVPNGIFKDAHAFYCKYLKGEVI